MNGYTMLGSGDTLISTSEIKWTDGSLVQLGTPIYHDTYGYGTISKLTSSEIGSPASKPRVEIQWKNGGSISWETSVLDAKYKQLPPPTITITKLPEPSKNWTWKQWALLAFGITAPVVIAWRFLVQNPIRQMRTEGLQKYGNFLTRVK